MFYVCLNGKNLKRFKTLQKAKFFAINYLANHPLKKENDDFLITNHGLYPFESIDVFELKHIY